MSEYGPEDYQTQFALARLAADEVDIEGIDLGTMVEPDPLEILIAIEEWEASEEYAALPQELKDE